MKYIGNKWIKVKFYQFVYDRLEDLFSVRRILALTFQVLVDKNILTAQDIGYIFELTDEYKLIEEIKENVK